jgi:aminotransferase in exopolysaccharide biosynthesis
MDCRTYDGILDFIRSLYPDEKPVPLHAPRFLGNEKKYLEKCIDTTIVSYVGSFVSEFESHLKRATGARNAVAIVNGTAALQMALVAVGVRQGDLVITQDLTFAATAAAICHALAQPAFVDVERETLGMSPESLEAFLNENAERREGVLHHRQTGQRIAAVVPMHTFGHPLRIEATKQICDKYGLPLIEDSAESLGSTRGGRHTGTFGRAGILSFNGNKPVTTGGGGMVITNDDELAERIRYISSTAKRKHRWEFFHDEVGYNLRMPNLNAALGCAQMEYLERVIENKRETAAKYAEFFASIGVDFFLEPKGAVSNYWLNVILMKYRADRDGFLEYSNQRDVQTRPAWTLMHKLPPYRDCPRGPVPNSEWLEDRIVNIPSSYRV